MGIQIACDYCKQPIHFEFLRSAGTFLLRSDELFSCVVCDDCNAKELKCREAAQEFGKRAQKEHYEQLMSELRKP